MWRTLTPARRTDRDKVAQGLWGQCSCAEPVLCSELRGKQDGGSVWPWMDKLPSLPVWARCVPWPKGNKADYLAAIKKSPGSSWGEVDKLPLSDKPIVMVVDAISWLFVSRHTWFSQPTQLPLILGDNLSMANWWQPWCWERQNLLYSNTAKTADAKWCRNVL